MFTKTLSVRAQQSLALLGKNNCLPEKTYMAGGSALALQFGHRISIDFDFFTPVKFDVDKIVKHLQKIAPFTFTNKLEDTLVGTFNQVRFSLFLYEYPILFKPILLNNVDILDYRDIAAMKIAAIMDRGSKKDFIDLYFIIKNGLTFDDIFNYYNKKYKALANNLYSIITSLSYFVDAENTEMPKMIEKVSWNEVKKFFEKEAVALGRKNFQ